MLVASCALDSAALWLEYGSVLKRSEVTAMHGLSTSDVADFEIAKTRFNLNVWTPASALKQLEKKL